MSAVGLCRTLPGSVGLYQQLSDAGLNNTKSRAVCLRVLAILRGRCGVSLCPSCSGSIFLRGQALQHVRKLGRFAACAVLSPCRMSAADLGAGSASEGRGVDHRETRSATRPTVGVGGSLAL
eukprot:5684075-Prymnesium_polylepis.1